MKRFWASSAMLLVGIGAALVTALLLGRFRQPPSLVQALFSEPDSSLCTHLCIVGIQPDQADLFNVMRSNPVLKQLEFYTPSSLDDRIEGYQANAIRIQASENRQWIEVQLDKNFGTTPPTTIPIPHALKGDLSLAEVIAIFGPPDQVLANSFETARNGRTYSERGLLLFFQRDRYLAMGIVLAQGQTLDMSAALSYLSVNVASQTGIDPAALQRLPPWQGFVSIDHYQMKNR